ncbi:AzlD domain-containing protein [Desulfohalobium retbaense]|uniref:Branched-chain amino acid transport n=1 Tax=Desulfohalobium retbaense (strain ATCC 49708 / DSM 5692 / JCM 16813 / HR100) TaxID=485915 RepID=C8X2V9_DESRD|nr:AzlD domain-containing protein [Desulfohalobium retbaense]ACV68756.1 branched-chain amino acid transport [Desulfohalobium retbaense DSM 5692]
MDQHAVFLIILGMMAVTYLPRALPMTVLSSFSLPDWVVRWLGCVPAAVLAALLFPSLLLRDGAVSLGLENIFLWAAVPTFVVAKWRGSFVGAIVTGMGVVALARLAV